MCFWFSVWPPVDCGAGQRVAFWFQCWKNWNYFLLLFRIAQNSSFRMVRFPLFSKLDEDCCIFFAKTASKKSVALICLMKVISCKVAIYIFRSTIWPCMEHYCQVCWAAALTLLTYLEWLTNCWNITNRYYFAICCSSELAKLRSAQSNRFFWIFCHHF